jgi:hypothetical protein
MNTHPVRIARTELRRKLRSTASSQTRLALYALGGLFFFLPALLFGSLLSVVAGELFAEGSTDGLAVAETVVGGTAVVVLGLIIMTTIRTVTSVANPDNYEPGYLFISTSLRNIVSGLVLREIALFLLWLGPFAIVFSSAFAWGASAPLVPVATLATLPVVLGIAVPVGFVVGTAIRHLLTVYEPVAKYRTFLVVGFWLVYMLAVALNLFDQIFVVFFEVFGNSPLGWPGQLLVLGLPGARPTLWQAPVGVVGGAGIGFMSVGLGVRLADRHWFADPAQSADETETEVGSGDTFATLLSGLSGPTRRVAVTTLRRAKRAPIRLAYVAYPLFGAVYIVEQIVRTRTLPAFAAVLLAVYVVWASGVLFTLNILGDRGPALDAVLTATVSGRAVVTGTVIAAVLVALPFAIVVPVVAGLLSPLGGTQTALLTGGTLVGSLVTPLLATGIGSRFPRFGAVTVTRNTEAVMPSKTAFVVYSVGIGLPLGCVQVLRSDSLSDMLAGLFSFLFSLLPGVAVTIPDVAITVIAAVIVAVGAIAPILSVWSAVRQFDEYRPY